MHIQNFFDSIANSFFLQTNGKYNVRSDKDFNGIYKTKPENYMNCNIILLHEIFRASMSDQLLQAFTFGFPNLIAI